MIKKTINYAKNNEIFPQFSRFVVVGVINTSFNYLVYLALLDIAHFYYIYCGIAGFLTGAITAFFMNRFWTFKSNVCLKAGLLSYLLVQLFCLLIHVSVQYGVTETLHLKKELSQFPSIVVTTFINFFLVRKIVFAKR